MHQTPDTTKACAHYSAMAVQTLRAELDFVRDMVWDQKASDAHIVNALRAYFPRLPVAEVSDSDFSAFDAASREAA